MKSNREEKNQEGAARRLRDDCDDMSGYFYKQSKLNQLVLTIEGFQGGKLAMYPPYGGANQLWKWGPGDILVSKMGLALGGIIDILFQHPPFSLFASPPGSSMTLNWQYENDELEVTAPTTLVMDLLNGNTEVSAAVGLYERNGGYLNQKWILLPESKLSENKSKL